MAEIEVQPPCLRQMAGRLRTIGRDFQPFAGYVRGFADDSNGAPPATSAALSGLGYQWERGVRDYGQTVEGLGELTEASADAYEETDCAVMPGG